MAIVLEVCGLKEESGKTKYKCVVSDNKTKWLERHKIANFNEVINPYAEAEKATAKEIERIANETRVVYNFLLEKKRSPGIRNIVKRKGELMYIYENDKNEIEVFYSKEDESKHINEVLDFFESKIKFE